MLNKEVAKLLNCDNCRLKECIQCEISYSDKKLIREYIEELETAKEMKEALELANIDLKTLMSLKYENDRLKADKRKLIEKLEQDSSNSFTVEHKNNHKTILKQKIKPVRDYIKQELLPFLEEKSENEDSK